MKLNMKNIRKVKPPTAENLKNKFKSLNLISYII